MSTNKHRDDAIRATSSLEWLLEHIESESERMPASDIAALREVAEQLSSARYTIASKSETLAYVADLHQKACDALVKARRENVA